MRKFLLLVLLLTITNVSALAITGADLSPDDDAYLDPQLGFFTIFTPEVCGTDVYIDWIEQHCHKTLYVAIYTLTDEVVVNEYIKLAKQGKEVHIIMDASEERAIKKEGALVAALHRAGCEVIITTSSKKHALMHSKFTVCDGKFVESGSWNYTQAANNQSNYLDFNIIPSPKRAKIFMDAWKALYEYAKNQ